MEPIRVKKKVILQGSKKADREGHSINYSSDFIFNIIETIDTF